MDTIKKFKNDITAKVNAFLNSGQIFAVNEVAANMMAGIVMMVMIILILIALCLNEAGIFTASKTLMRIGALVSIIIQVPLAAINQKFRGDKKWLKNVLQIGLLALSVVMSVCLGHNVTLIMVIPVLISTRYFDAKFTKRVFIITVLLYFLTSVFAVYWGTANLNVFKVPEGTVITVGKSLRSAIENANPERTGYYTRYLLNDLAPRLFVFLVIGLVCVKIAQRGREMIDIQTQYTEKSSRIETELNLATKIQTGMLPCIFPAFPEIGQLQLYAKNIPAKEVGGDFYDYFQIDDNHVALVMADVSGKGVGAALFMTISKIVIKNLIQSGLGPAEAMTKANKQLCENNEAGLFVTTWVGIFNSSNGELTYSNAGHNPPVIIKNNGECYYLKVKSGFVLAGLEGIEYQEDTISLGVGDELFLYTDGVTEATDKNNKLYGEKRLLNTINTIKNLSSEDQINKIIEDIKIFTDGAEQFDDITMMAMKIQEK